jgi:hypothetical protein
MIKNRKIIHIELFAARRRTLYAITAYRNLQKISISSFVAMAFAQIFVKDVKRTIAQDYFVTHATGSPGHQVTEI